MTRAGIVCAALVGGAIVATPGLPATARGRQLVGTTGPAFVITLTRDGEPVTTLEPGNYWLTVNDLSTFHNFHIFGPDLDNVVTTVSETGTVTVKIHLRQGAFTFQCDPHANRGMRGTFTVQGDDEEGDD